ncbi:MAG TPA: tetratricopeptide repeat protein [Candidatus Methylomirabilis sp.]|nr:tetratricopeptide repeat protein [Candidatus Methylomirabilis sp.]
MAFDKRKALQNALAFTQQGRWDKAIAEYQAILRADPRDLTVCNNLGDLYARTGKPAEAIEQYLKLGDLYRTDGLSVKAIAVYKKIAKLDPNRTEAYLACADLYQEQGLVGEAKVQLATVVEHYSKAGDTTKVIEIYQRLAQLDPANHTLSARLADLLSKQGMREAAAAEYGRAAHAAQAVGQTAESKRLFQKARDMLPDSPEPNLGLAEFQLREGLYAEAVSVLGKVTSADAGNLRAWRLLGEAYGCLGQGAEAIEALQQAVALGLPEAEVSRPLALALVQAGRTDEAVALCQRFTEDAVSREEPEAAVSLCQAMVAATPHLTTLHAQLASLLQRLGRSQEARAATWALAAAYEAAGESEAAIHVYHQLLESDPSDVEAQARLEVLETVPPPTVAQEQAAVPLPALEEEAALLLEAPSEAETAGPEAPEFVLPEMEEEPTPVLETPRADSPAPADSEETFWTPEAGPALTSAEAISASPPTGLPLDVGEEVDLHPVEPPEAETTAGPPAGEPSRIEEAGGFGEIELPSVELPEAEAAAGGLEAGVAEDGPAVDFLGEGMAGLGALEGEGGPSSAVAEQLAEAEVYLKYGLAEKARERLKEVVRLAPDNLVAHRKLKAIYLERNQIPEACQEILAIAENLEARLQPEAALREIQEGLELAPADPQLQAHLSAMRRGMAPASPEASRASVATDEPPMEEVPLDLPETLGVAPEPSVQGMPVLQGGIPPSPGEERATPEEVPALEVPLDMGGEAELASEPSPDVEAGAAPTSLGDEELPPELRALLEEAGEAPALEVEGIVEDQEQLMADDLAEAMFYIDQGMLDEARSVHERMQGRDPEHPAAISLGSRLATSTSEGVPETLEVPVAEAASPPSEDSEELAPPLDLPDLLPSEEPSVLLDGETVGFPFGGSEETPESQPYELPTEIEGVETAPGVADVPADSALEPSLLGLEPKFTLQDAGSDVPAQGFVDLGTELDEELASEEQAAPPTTGGPLMDGLLKEFQKGVREHLDEKDFETHYNLGIAYREMELYEEAVQEFRLAGREPGRALACADLLGLCFLAMGQIDQALVEFRAGLEIRGHPRESYHTLRYDLGVAYETQGDLAHALEQFEHVHAEDPRFRDVRAKAQSLRERQPRAPAAGVPGGPAPTEATPGHSRSKKISFI